MEKRDSKILKFLLSVCSDGKYVVVKVVDILSEVHWADTAETRKEVVAAVKTFVDAEFIGCKFYDSDNVCCMSMPKGRSWTEESEKANTKNTWRWWIGGICFVCALLGSFFGTVLANLI